MRRGVLEEAADKAERFDHEHAERDAGDELPRRPQQGFDDERRDLAAAGECTPLWRRVIRVVGAPPFCAPRGLLGLQGVPDVILDCVTEYIVRAEQP